MKRWVQWFADRGHEVHVVTYEDDLTHKDIDNVKYHSIPTLEKSSLRHLPRSSRWGRLPYFKKVMKGIEPDVVVGHYIVYYGLPLAFCGPYPKILVAWGSDVLLTPKSSRFEMWVAKTSAKRADLIISVAPHIKEEIVRWKISQEKIMVNPLGVDTKIFTPDGPKIDNGRPIIISTRALEEIYDVKTLIEAIPKIKESYPNVLIWIIGRGEEKQKLEELVKSLSIEKNVQFLDYVSDIELPKLLRSADIYVTTSLSDGTSASLLEALACGIPVIASDISANRPWIKNDYLFSPSNPRKLAQVILDSGFKPEKPDIDLKSIDWNENMKIIEIKLQKMIKEGVN